MSADKPYDVKETIEPSTWEFRKRTQRIDANQLEAFREKYKKEQEAKKKEGWCNIL